MGGDLVAVGVWAGELDAVHERFVHRFSRTEPRESALAYMRGLIAPLERKNGWTLAEQAGHAAPDRIHRLLNRIEWEADEVLDDVRDYVVEHLGDPEAVLIVDDTGCAPPTPQDGPPARNATLSSEPSTASRASGPSPPATRNTPTSTSEPSRSRPS
jgi:hypothetical protein